MVGKGFVGIMLSLLILLSTQPFNASDAATRAFEKYDMENLPPQDQNGNYTLDEDDEWTITGEAFLDGNITLFEESVIIMEDANITVNGTIWARDQSEIIIRSSNLTLTIPMPGPVLIERQYDNPNGFMLIEDEVTFTIENSSIYLSRHDISQTAPEGMMIPIEVFVNFGTFSMLNSYLNTVGSISLGSFNQTIIRGIVMHLNSEFYIADSNITSGIVFYVNAHGTIQNTDFRSLSMQKNTAESLVEISNCSITHTASIAESSNSIFRDCQLGSVMIVSGHGRTLLINTTIEGLILEDNATMIMDKSNFPVESIIPGGNHVRDSAILTLSNSSFVKKLLFYDNASVVFDNSSMNCTILTENAKAILSESHIENLSAEDNTSVWLKSSNLIQYNLSNDARIYNITTLAVATTLNHQPLSVPVELKDSGLETFASANTDKKGRAEFVLIRDIISIDKATQELILEPHITYCTATSSFENLNLEKGVNVTGKYIEVNLDFVDYTPPEIADVHFVVNSFMNTNEDVHITVQVHDEGTNLTKVLLKYSTDDGESWKNLTLYSTGENVYENSIPGQADETQVRFYIESEDKAGNRAESQYYSYTTGETVTLVNNLIVIGSATLVLGLLILFIAKSSIGKRRTRKYLHSAPRKSSD